MQDKHLCWPPYFFLDLAMPPPSFLILESSLVRRVPGKMDKFVVVQHKRKRSSSRERDFCKRDRNDTSSCSESASLVFSSENDIGNFAGVPLTDADRRKVLFNCWSPTSGFSFPYVTVGAQNRSFQKQWINEFTWLAYSNIYNGAFCKWCIVFAPQTVSRSTKPPGSLVSGPHCKYKKAKEHYNNHQNRHYHKLCAAMFDNCVQTDADKSRDVRNALNSSRQRAVEENLESSFPYQRNYWILRSPGNTIEGSQRRWCIFTKRNWLQWRSVKSSLKTGSGGCWQANIWPL